MKRADFIRQHAGISVLKAMTDEELANFYVALERDRGNTSITPDECYRRLQQQMEESSVCGK